MDKVEVLYEDLVRSYGEANDAQVRAASKLLMVALFNLKRHAGHEWHSLVSEYLGILQDEPERFERFLESNRSDYQEDVLIIPVHNPDKFQA
jgi:hypothetical protein